MEGREASEVTEMPEQSTTTPASVSEQHAPKFDRWFYISVGLLMILFNAFAFAPSLIDSSRRNVPLPLTPLVVLHTMVSVAWLVLFLIQATLIANSRRATHRRLGIFGALLAVAFVVLVSLSVVAEARRGFDLSGDIGRLPPVPGTDKLTGTVGLLLFPFQFAVLVGAALFYRNRPAVHKRLMLIAMLGALTPTPVAHVIGRWIGPQQWAGSIFPLSLLFFLSIAVIHDRIAEGRVHPVSLWVGVLVFVSNMVFTLAIMPTAAWRAFSIWLIH